MSRILQLIDEIEEFIETCKTVPLASSKVIVHKDDLYELLTELRLKTPDEVTKAQRLLEQKDNLVADAKKEAERLIMEATNKTSELVSEHEIMLQAYAEAQNIIDQAKSDAQTMRMGALEYVDDMLANLEKLTNNIINEEKTRYGELLNSLQQQYDVVSENRKEIRAQLNYKAPSEDDEQEES